MIWDSLFNTNTQNLLGGKVASGLIDQRNGANEASYRVQNHPKPSLKLGQNQPQAVTCPALLSGRDVIVQSQIC